MKYHEVLELVSNRKVRIVDADAEQLCSDIIVLLFIGCTKREVSRCIV